MITSGNLARKPYLWSQTKTGEGRMITTGNPDRKPYLCNRCGEYSHNRWSIRVGHNYPPGIEKPLDPYDDEHVECLCDACMLKETERFMVGAGRMIGERIQPTDVCPAGHRLPQPAIGMITCPTCLQAAGKDLPTCILCKEPGPDYSTHILVKDHGRNLGHLRVKTHMDCLLEKGSTAWSISWTPQLTQEHLDQMFDLNLDNAIRAYTLDLRLFYGTFHDLEDEIDTKTTILKRALRYFSTGGAVWYGIQRPVDLLAILRNRWAEVEATEPHKLFVQRSLF